MTAFVAEMPRYKDSSGAVPSHRPGVWFVAYLGLLPSFLIQLRWPPAAVRRVAVRHWPFSCRSCGDVAAYFTGRFLGRHRMIAAAQSQEDVGGVRRRMAGAVAAA